MTIHSSSERSALEIALDRRQRDVHDRVVEHDHEEADRRRLRASATCGSPLRRSEPACDADTSQRAPGDFTWTPIGRAARRRERRRLARSLGCADYEELHRLSIDDPDRFWRAVVADLEIPLARAWDDVLDDSRGIEWTTWFVGARLNVADACVHRWARETPDREAAVWAPEEGERRVADLGGALARGAPARGGAARARNRRGRRRRHVPADGARGRDRLARVRARRRGAGADLLRLRRACGLRRGSPTRERSSCSRPTPRTAAGSSSR